MNRSIRSVNSKLGFVACIDTDGNSYLMLQNISPLREARHPIALRMSSLRVADDTAFGSSAHSSSIDHTWSDSPLSIAGVPFPQPV
jgi:hypothetical protein